MPGLISLKTDLKSLKYNSMPLGSDAPYVNKDINKPQSSNGVSMQAAKRVDDLTRISKMLIDKPGLKYLANEALLQQEGVSKKIDKARQSGKSLVGALVQQAGKTAIGTVKILGSTLAQVPVNGTGTHFVKGFKTDTYLQPTGGNTRSKFAQFFGAGGIEGAPLSQVGSPIEGEVISNLTKKPGATELPVVGYKNLSFDGPVSDIRNAKPNSKLYTNEIGSFANDAENGNSIDIPVQSKLVSKSEETTVDPLTGFLIPVTVDGPVTGKGDLTYNRKLNPNYIDDKLNINKPSTEKILIPKQNAQTGEPIPVLNNTETTKTPGSLQGSISNQNIVGEQEQILVQNTFITGSEKGLNTYQGTLLAGTPSTSNQEITGDTNQETFVKPVITDFREGSTTSYAFNYSAPTIRKEKRVNLGDQGATSKVKLDYTANLGQADEINLLDVRDTKADMLGDGRDLIKFYFEIITPDGSKFLHFRALLDSFDDNYAATWDARKYVGRAENFYTYGGFDRSISFSFKIAAATRAEMKPLYKKMVYLASSTAPTYQTNGGFMRGTLAKVTIGSYLSQIPGVIESVKYTWNTEYPWEIAMQNPENGIDDDMQELPMIMDCSISFKPIHDFAPQTGLKHFITNPAPAGGSKAFF